MSDEKTNHEENQEQTPSAENKNPSTEPEHQENQPVETQESVTRSTPGEVLSELESKEKTPEEVVPDDSEATTETFKKPIEDHGEDDEDEEEEIESSDEEDNDEKEEKTQKDYSSLSKKALVTELERLLKTEKVQNIKDEVQEIRSEFNNRFNEELEEKKEGFIAGGGNIIDFHYSTPIKKEFNSLYFDYKEKRNNYYKNLKRDLQKNLDRRWELIEELKGLLGTEENFNTTYNHFKQIQDNWHTAGPIPRDKYNTVWNTYHHHVENFYDFLHLNREFRDLDFKHNLDAKLKIITRAEELAQEKDVHKAFRELQMLHKMWKEDIGPVAKEYREEIWDKFSEATRVIHEKRQGALDELEKEFQENYDKKIAIIENIAKKSEETPSSHKAWQKAIKDVQKLRDEFFEIGRVPRAKNKEIWKEFKETTRKFNREKNSFYKNQKKQQYENLEKKRELIKIAEEHKDSDDFEVVTPLMKKIQEDWKHIGHVPHKESDKVWKQFKKACNHYFDKLHADKNKAGEEEIANYEFKKELLEKLSSLELSGDHKADLKLIKEQIAGWKEIGKVPYNKRKITQKFNKVLDGLFSKLDLGKKEKELIKFDNKLNAMVTRDDERKLRNEHFFISKKIQETEDEIRQLENNLGFFHHADENNPLVQDVRKNIAQHKEQLEVWKAKLSKIRKVREE